jgi:hypothetical protein
MSELDDKEILLNLKKYFNFSNFKSDTQEKAIKNILKGKLIKNRKIKEKVMKLPRLNELLIYYI